MDKITTFTITHPTGKYPVMVGSRLLPRLRELAAITGPIALITDSHVAPLYAQHCGEVTCTLTIPAGEEHKTLATANQLYGQLLEFGLDRQGTIVALGGGVTGDVAGFVAATYLRGVDFVQCPTTLLAMVDASVGGKTGVDLPQGKNLVGAFKQPTAVLADVDTLQTLPDEEFAAGMAEVIKHGLIQDPGLFASIEQEGERYRNASPARLQLLVSQAIQVKRQVVQADPFEQGRRALLNLGHTFGHALEQVSHYQIRHGQAVAIGLMAAADLSLRLGYCPAALPGRLQSVLAQVGLPTQIPSDLEPAAIYRAMFTDKKKRANRLRFILLRDVGQAFIAEDVPETAVMASLTAVQAA